MRTRSHLLAFALFLTACASSQSAAAQPLTAADSLALDVLYADWRLPHEADLARAMDPSCGRPPLMLDGDFDGDGRADRAALVVPADSTQKVGRVEMVVLFQRPARMHAVHIDAAGSGGWETVRAGAFVSDFLGEESVVLETDGLEVYACEKASFVLYYKNGAFVDIATGD